MSSRHYTKAPIIEAVIDLKLMMPLPTASLEARLKQEFRETFPIQAIGIGVDIVANSHFSSQQTIGTRFQSKERVLQIQNTGFTYSHLAPYSEWDVFRSEAQRYWDLIRTEQNLSEVTRVAVRVINRLPLAATFNRIADYTTLNFTTALHGANVVVDRSFIQAQASLCDHLPDGQVLINASIGHMDGSNLELLLDFDLFVLKTFRADSIEIWDALNALSTAKDEVFEACITDKFRDLIA